MPGGHSVHCNHDASTAADGTAHACARHACKSDEPL